ncbi:MAG TPA: potassium-transporting ATPase subunit KdpA [Solirubrobacteraceae bacterium]|nr:potassium-transporting ATPase subunit KdpA [Solirubrobacteraceae bacterium]
MSVSGWLQIAALLVVLTTLTRPLGGYIDRVFSGERVLLARALRPFERRLTRLLAGAQPGGQDWKEYARSVVLFSGVCWLALYLILRTQSIQPLNPQGFGSPPWDVTFNIASSFVSNSSWQFYGGETTLSNFSQMAGITVHSFLSGCVGLAAGIAIVRGFASHSGKQLGNFWVDLIRGLLYVLLPLAIAASLFLVAEGSIQTLAANVHISTLTGGQQTLALGPVASEKAINVLSSDGGGFFAVNSAMPFEDPTGLTNFIEALMMLVIPAALTATYGRMVGDRRQGWALYGVMAVMLAGAAAVAYPAESGPSPAMRAAGVHGVNMEGKEQRLQAPGSTLTAVAGTTSSGGTTSAALDSFSGLGGSIPMADIMTGEVIFGGVGSGLFGMLLMVLLAVFIAGLMVGRTPEYLGKKIEADEIKLVTIGVILVPLIVLFMTAWAISTRYGLRSISNPGPQGFSETLYAYTSQANNNGSAFAGYVGFVQPHAPGNVGASGITFADLAGGGAMLLGRFVPMLIALAVAGSLSGKRTIVSGAGTMRTDTFAFAGLLIATISIVALLTFVPALMLGPLVQALTPRLF